MKPKDIKKLIDRINKTSNADFVKRLKDKNRESIFDWENKNNYATHKLSWTTIDDNRAIVYPNVQHIDGRLYDFTDPRAKHKKWDSLDSAIERGDTLMMSPKEAKMFTEQYKDHYPKFLEGGKIYDYIKDPSAEVYKNNLMIDKAIATAEMETEFAKFLGNGLMQLSTQAAGLNIGKNEERRVGGKISNKVPIEVESNELIKFYDQFGDTDKIYDIGGNISHEEGGVDVNVDVRDDRPNPVVFSSLSGKKLSEKISKELSEKIMSSFGIDPKDNRSFADKEKARQRKLNKFESKSKYDSLYKNTSERIKVGNKIEENRDTELMQLAFDLGQKQEFLTGGIVDWLKKQNRPFDFKSRAALAKQYNIANYTGKDFQNKELLKILQGVGNSTDSPQIDLNLTEQDFKPSVSDPLSSLTTKDISSLAENIFPEKAPRYGEKPIVKDKLGFNPVIGDILGIAGNVYKGYKDKQATNESIATDQPNQNFFKNFGKDSLETISGFESSLAQNRDTLLKELDRSMAGARSSNRASARGVNTTRALDITLQSKENESMDKILNSYASQLLQVGQAKAQTQLQRDQAVMQGEAQRDDNDRRDKEARIMAKRQSDMNIGELITSMGDYLNRSKERRDTQSLLNDTSQYFDYDFRSGKIKSKDAVQHFNKMLEDGSWVNFKDRNGNTPKTEGEFLEMLKKEGYRV